VLAGQFAGSAFRRYRFGMTRYSLPIRFSVDGSPVGGETLVTEAGASVVVLASTSAALGIELRSAYLEGERNASVLVADSGVIGGEPAELSSRLLDAGEEPMTYGGDGCSMTTCR
jgi:hypothetical protein